MLVSYLLRRHLRVQKETYLRRVADYLRAVAYLLCQISDRWSSVLRSWHRRVSASRRTQCSRRRPPKRRYFTCESSCSAPRYCSCNGGSAQCWWDAARGGAAVRVGTAGDAVLGLASARRRGARAPHAAQAALPRRVRLRRVQTRARARALHCFFLAFFSALHALLHDERSFVFTASLSFATNAGFPF